MRALTLPQPLQLLVVEDHALYIEGLKLALKAAPFKIEVMACSTIAQGKEWLQNNTPHIALLDLHLPDGSGWQLLEWIDHEVVNPVPCVVLTGSDAQADLDKALAAGAQGYIHKGIDSQGLIDAIYSVMNGNVYTPNISSMALSAEERAKISGITPRQYEVLNLLAQGLPNKLICQQLNLTADTVKSHLKALFLHFGVHNRTECVASAVKQQLIEIGSH